MNKRQYKKQFKKKYGITPDQFNYMINKVCSKEVMDPIIKAITEAAKTIAAMAAEFKNTQECVHQTKENIETKST